MSSNKPLIIPKLGGINIKKIATPNNNINSNNIHAATTIEKKGKGNVKRIVNNNDHDKKKKTTDNKDNTTNNGKTKKSINRISSNNDNNSSSNSSNKKLNKDGGNDNNSNNNNNDGSSSNWWTIDYEKPIVTKLSEDAKWFTILNEFESEIKVNNTTTNTNTISQYPIPQQSLLKITGIVEKLYNDDVIEYQKSKKTSSDSKWINDVIKSGTLSDKVAALSLSIQDSPLHQLETLDLLISMATKKEQRMAQLALEALKDLLIHNVLPDRRLKPFLQQPLGHPKMTIKIALSYWYEGQLISRVESIVRAIESGLMSNIEYFKKICMQLAADLLVNKPEQEAKLLNILVNKLGDSKGNIYSKCTEILKDVLRKHPNMKPVVVREIRQLIFKPSASPRLVYHGIIFLSNIHLSQRDCSTAASLVETYVSLFERAIGQDELGSKLLAALLTGVNRAFPYLNDIGTLAKHTDALFRLVHKGSFAASVQALVLISHIALGDSSITKDDSNNRNDSNERNDSNKEAIDKLINRFYRALYAKLLDNQITAKGRNTMFLNLLFRSIKNDPSDDRCMAFIKRLCMSTLQSSASIAAGLLYMISEIISTRPSLTPLMTEIEAIATTINKNNNNDDDDEDDGSKVYQLGNYDASKREPEFANSGTPSLWELSLLRMHYHPSVRAFSTSLLDPPHKIIYGGDPTVEFTLSTFLNQFAYKNPKQKVNIHITRAKAKEEEPLNTSEFMKLDAKDVDPEKLFFHKYFAERERLLYEGKMKSRSKKKTINDDDDDYDEDKDHDDDDDDDVDENLSAAGSDADEAEIDKFATKLAMDLMKKQANGDGPDIDDDFSMSDDDDDDDDENYDYGDKKEHDEFFDKYSDDDDEDNDDGDDDDDDDDFELQAYGDDDDENDHNDDDNDYINDNKYEYDEQHKSSTSLKRKSAAAPAELLQHEKKKKKKKLSSSSSLSDFASAEDYEDMMEENIKKFKK